MASSENVDVLKRILLYLYYVLFYTKMVGYFSVHIAFLFQIIFNKPNCDISKQVPEGFYLMYMKCIDICI